MLAAALKLRALIIAHFTSQKLDLSMNEVMLTDTNWDTLCKLERFFAIFVRPSEKMQGSRYLTFSAVIPLYMPMANKLYSRRLERETSANHTSATNETFSHSNIATICDPRINHAGFDILFPYADDSVIVLRWNITWFEGETAGRPNSKFNAPRTFFDGLENF